MKICFLVGSMSISGGTYVIIQHASFLQGQGYDVTMAIQEPFSTQTLSWHDEAVELRCLPINDAKAESFDLVIATWWKTVFELCNFNSLRYAYFVQSIESKFYPDFEIPLRNLVESTYRFPVEFITEATWIKDTLMKDYGRNSTLVKNGIRKDVYSVIGPTVSNTRIDDQPRVLIEGHFGVSFKNTALGIKLAREAGARDIWVLTGSNIRWLPGVSRIFSRVSMLKTPEIYRSCDILIKLSTVEGMFGPPLEQFHCGGTAIVFDVSGHDEYIVNNVNSFVVSKGSTSAVVEKIKVLLTDRHELNRLKDGAMATAAAWPSWAVSSGKFMDWVNGSGQFLAVDRTELLKMTDEAFSIYSVDENFRQSQSPSIVRRHKLSALSDKFHPWIKSKVKELEAILEVLSTSRRVY